MTLTVDCHLALGDVNAAALATRRLTPYLEDDLRPSSLAHHARGEVAAAEGRADLAVDHFHAAGHADLAAERAGDAPCGGLSGRLLPWQGGAALAHVALGRRAEAHDLAEAQLAAAQIHGEPYDVALALRTLAVAAPTEAPLARLQQARDLLLTTDAARLRAQIETDVASHLVMSGRLEEAVPMLRSVERYAARHDLRPLHARAGRMLERLGHQRHRLEDEVLAHLTAGERRVAHLALRGYTNRRIAEQLGVSVKAVESHLSKAYRKLGVESRRAMVDVVEGTSA
ncbi:MAG: hypothetical protein CMH83_14665 [Nocardioides sp.]|nr:hypothetical protein [Nocardioides sp.]